MGTINGYILILNALTLREESKIDGGSRHAIYSISISMNGNFLVVGSSDYSIKVWDIVKININNIIILFIFIILI